MITLLKKKSNRNIIIKCPEIMSDSMLVGSIFPKGTKYTWKCKHQGLQLKENNMFLMYNLFKMNQKLINIYLYLGSYNAMRSVSVSFFAWKLKI